MRILTPAELRYIEQAKLAIPKIDEIVITNDNRELWLNILDMALSKNEGMKKEWTKNYG